jgi:hypothetical protein
MTVSLPKHSQFPAIDPASLIVRCIEAERSRALSARSLFKINLHLRTLPYCFFSAADLPFYFHGAHFLERMDELERLKNTLQIITFKDVVFQQ